MTPARLRLPFPVPLHACFIQGKHRGGGGVPTKRYRAYRADAEAAWREQGSPRVPGLVTVEIALVAPDARARDAGNLHKCVFDNLTRLGVIEDDSNKVVLAELWRWAPSGPPCEVIVRPVGLDLAAAEVSLPQQGRLL